MRASTGVVLRPLLWSMAGKEGEAGSAVTDAADRQGVAAETTEPAAATEPTTPAAVRGRLFRKYVALFVGVVCGAFLANGGFEMWFSYQEHKASPCCLL